MNKSVEDELNNIDQGVDLLFQQLNQPNVAQTLAGVTLSNIILSNRVAQLAIILRGPKTVVEEPESVLENMEEPAVEVSPVDTDAV